MRIMLKTREGKSSQRPAGVRRHLTEKPLRFSGDGRLYRQIARMVQHLPEVRHQRIEAVRKQLVSGEYRIDSGHLVELILEEAKETRRNYRAAA